MGKNQHVTPHPDGGWQVKGAGNSKATIRKQNCLFMEWMGAFGRETPTETIRILRKAEQTGWVYGYQA